MTSEVRLIQEESVDEDTIGRAGYELTESLTLERKNDPVHFYYKFLVNERYTTVMLAGRLPVEVPLDFIEKMADYVLSPKNILINCFCLRRMPFHWMNLFNSIGFILLNHNKKIGLVLVPPNIAKAIETGHTKLFKVHTSVREILMNFISEEKEITFNFIKGFIYSAVRTLLIQAKTPSSRKKIIGQDDIENRKLLGDVNGVILVTSEDFFYVVSLSFPENTFLRIISSTLNENIKKMNEQIKDGAAELISIILGQTKNLVNSVNSQIKTANPQTFLGNSLPNEKISFHGKDWPIFKNGLSVIIPFSSLNGEFFVEIWFPKDLKQKVLEKIK